MNSVIDGRLELERPIFLSTPIISFSAYVVKSRMAIRVLGSRSCRLVIYRVPINRPGLLDCRIRITFINRGKAVSISINGITRTALLSAIEPSSRNQQPSSPGSEFAAKVRRYSHSIVLGSSLPNQYNQLLRLENPADF
jgi:hypothetical protein